MPNEKLTKKNVNYKPYIKHYNNNYNNTKHIYIIIQAGFGNKVFDLMCAIYLYNLYNNTYQKCIINCILMKSHHDNINDPKLDAIFPQSKYKINFINSIHFNNLKNNRSIKLNHIELDSNSKLLAILDKFPKYENLLNHNIIDNVSNYHGLMYEIYKSFSKKDKDIFINFNKNILTDKNIINNIISEPYSLIHVRYGDKLYYLSQYINKPNLDINIIQNETRPKSSCIDQFLLYTPEYYIDKINELLKTTNENMKIYIITDSSNIVRQFIMNNNTIKNNSRIVFLDKMTWWDSFYLFYYASNIILSDSTFALAGSYFNQKNANCKIVIYHHNEDSDNISPKEYASDPYWKITNERKYILNYNPKIAYMIIKYKYFWTD